MYTSFKYCRNFFELCFKYSASQLWHCGKYMLIKAWKWIYFNLAACLNSKFKRFIFLPLPFCSICTYATQEKLCSYFSFQIYVEKQLFRSVWWFFSSLNKCTSFKSLIFPQFVWDSVATEQKRRLCYSFKQRWICCR